MPKEEKPNSKQINADVKRFGLHVVTVAADQGNPGWAYSIGLQKTFQQPEVLLFGLRPDTMENLLNNVAESMRTGTEYGDGLADDTLLEGYECRFRAMSPRWIEKTAGQAIAYYGETPVQMLQLFWPDRNGRFPWDPKCDAAIRALQPRLYANDANEARASWLL